MFMYLQTLQLEQSELVSAVDTVRDSAIELMNKSTKHQKMVEPELIQLNQRWEETSDKIKVSWW